VLAQIGLIDAGKLPATRMEASRKVIECLAGTIQLLDQTADCVKLIDKLRKANG